MTATAYNYDLPTTQEELDRKSIETLEKLILDHRNHRISTAQFDVGINTLFSVASGLVSRDFIELVTRASREETVGGCITDYQTRLFKNADSMIAVSYGYGEELFTLTTQKSVKARNYDTPSEAYAGFINMIEKLDELGYEDLN